MRKFLSEFLGIICQIAQNTLSRQRNVERRTVLVRQILENQTHLQKSEKRGGLT
jgi:hypothetical protein